MNFVTCINHDYTYDVDRGCPYCKQEQDPELAGIAAGFERVTPSLCYPSGFKCRCGYSEKFEIMHVAGCPNYGPGQEEDEHTFESGAKRSEVKPFYSAIPELSLRRLAMRATGTPKGAPPATLVVTNHEFHYAGGSRGYGYGNWKLGLEMEDTFNHVIDHLYKWKAAIERGHRPGDDDLAAAAWGIMLPLMTFEEDYTNGKFRKPHKPERK